MVFWVTSFFCIFSAKKVCSFFHSFLIAWMERNNSCVTTLNTGRPALNWCCVMVQGELCVARAWPSPQAWLGSVDVFLSRTAGRLELHCSVGRTMPDTNPESSSKRRHCTGTVLHHIAPSPRLQLEYQTSGRTNSLNIVSMLC